MVLASSDGARAEKSVEMTETAHPDVMGCAVSGRLDVVLDPDAGTGVIHIERAVVRVGDGFQVTTPMSDAGFRDGGPAAPAGAGGSPVETRWPGP